MKRSDAARCGGLDGRPKRYKRSRWRGDWYREIDVATQFHCSKWALRRARRSNERSIEVWHTRFLATDINQLSRVTNERRIGTKLFHEARSMYANVQARRVSPFATFTRLSDIRSRVFRPFRRALAPSESALLKLYVKDIREYKTVTTNTKRSMKRISFTTLFTAICMVYSNKAHPFANRSIMHNHAARRKVPVINDGDQPAWYEYHCN